MSNIYKGGREERIISIHVCKLKPIGSAIFLVEACPVRELTGPAS